ncbi:MAG: xylulokinase [Halioglobus sp.]
MYLGIDVGTQSVKALIYDAQSREVAAVASAPLQLISEADGTREQEAQWWLEALSACLSDIDPALRDQVQAVGVSAQQHGFVPLGPDGEVLAPVKLWCDTATTLECAEITASLGGVEACIAQMGNPVLPGYTAPKILWLKKHRAESYAKLATILLPHDYINYYLTGELAMEYGDASGTGLMNVRERSWHAAALKAIDDQRDLGEALPVLLDAGEQMGCLRSTSAETLGLPPGIPVATGGGDNMMAAIGTGNVSPGKLTVSLGTSGTLYAFSDEPVIDPAGNIAAFCSSTGGWLPLLCTMNCTVATEVSRQLFGLSLDALQAATESVPPGSGGVLTLPFFNGERTPNLPNGKACILGLDEDNYHRDNLLRSAMESAVYGLRTGLDGLSDLGLPMSHVRLTGGGAQSAVWRQMVADVLQLPVTVQTVDEGAALGAALQALWMHSGDGAKSLPALLDEHLAVDEARSCEPRADVAALYEEHYANYVRHVEVIGALYP